ncbi:hypothetical protein M8C21_013010, partial [Ambrosia artemisiifolia]
RVYPRSAPFSLSILVCASLLTTSIKIKNKIKKEEEEFLGDIVVEGDGVTPHFGDHCNSMLLADVGDCIPGPDESSHRPNFERRRMRFLN